MLSEWARSGHPCGKGSVGSNTELARQAVDAAMRKTGAQSVCDIGAGLGDWLDVPRIKLDLVKWDDETVVTDITAKHSPECDLAIARFVFIHMTEREIESAVRNIKAKHILATTFPGSEETGGGDYWRPDMSRLLGEPVTAYADFESYLGLWELGGERYKWRSPATQV